MNIILMNIGFGLMTVAVVALYVTNRDYKSIHAEEVAEKLNEKP